MKIAGATTADISALAALWHTGWHEAHAAIVPPELTALRIPDEFRDRVTAHLADTFVGWVDARIVGFVMVQGDELYQLFTAPDVRGTGVAQALIAYGEALIAMRTDRAWLACARGNGRAARFYEKSGWVRGDDVEHAVETSQGPFQANLWRFEKEVRP